MPWIVDNCDFEDRATQCTRKRKLTATPTRCMVCLMSKNSDIVTKTKVAIQVFISDGYATKRALAERANLPETTLIGLERPDWNPRTSTLAALARALEKLEAERKRRPRYRAAYQPAA